MIPFDEIEVLAKPLLALQLKFEESVITDIARRIGNMNFASASWQTQRLIESGVIYDEILEKIGRLTPKTEAELRLIFQHAGVRNREYDNKFFQRQDLQVFNKLSPQALQVLNTGFRLTAGTMRNMTATTALAGQESFIGAVDLAWQQITAGAMDYQSAVNAAVMTVGRNGVQVIQYGRHRDQLDVATRRAVLTGVGKTMGDLTMQNITEMGTDLVEVSAHVGARNTGDGPANHEDWQGQIYSIMGHSLKYKPFEETTGYGTGEGLLGWNCRHSFYPYFEGAERVLTPEEVEEMNTKMVTLDGKELSFYEATQKQRAMERDIRALKRQALALSTINQSNARLQQAISVKQSKIRDFLRQTGLQRQRVREQVVNQKQIVWRR